MISQKGQNGRLLRRAQSDVLWSVANAERANVIAVRCFCEDGWRGESESDGYVLCLSFALREEDFYLLHACQSELMHCLPAACC